ncbi:MAG: ABC transporter ATP-binding protein/permease [Anaeroplasmataceae bacterium]|nr:ABC transporter ATP-binding protein/permease [Anaeroplasmataceae bacterium]MDE6414316.1 ABC transporter ATP-binding protein/permease [Anaeroplasmataceae bacterium]
MIKIKNLNKYYNKGKDNEIHVIHDVTLELPDTGLISFLGTSGSGKTTLLNVIGGLDRAKGSITYDSMSMENYKMGQIDKFRSKEIGYVFQNYNLLLEETVYSNLEIALEMIGVFDKEEQEKRIEYTLNAVGMYKYRKKRAYALSGGQQQRVSIARALVKQARIIIADEPTGNLDSENTIEVMNILKKISKTSLVLVVTHNEEVANFYSDEVIQIKDGSIISTYKNEGGQALKTEQANTIYLKDMELKEQQGEHVSLKYYSTKEAKPLELRIIEKNGTYYISASEKLKLLEDTNIKVVDSHYQALKQEALEQFEYDTSWFSQGKGKENIFKKMLKGLATSFNKMRFSKRRAKFLYASFFIIGLLLAICVFGFSNYYIIDDSDIRVDKKYDVLTTDEIYKGSRDFIDATYSVMPYVKNINSGYNKYYTFHQRINYVESIDYRFDFQVISYMGNEDLKILSGQTPQKGEILLSKRIADDFMKENGEFFRSYDELLGFKIDSYIVSGIVDNPYAVAYLDDETYMKRYESSPRYFSLRNYKIEKKYSTYDIVAGRDLTDEDLGKNFILIPSNYFLYKELGDELLNQEINFLGNKVYTIVGVFKLKNYTSDVTYDFISNDKEINYSATFTQNNSYVYKDYQIVEGKDATSFDECIASVYSDYKVGDVIKDLNGSSTTFKVVGLFYGENDIISIPVLYSREVVILSNDIYSWLVFDDKANIKEIQATLESQGFYAKNIYDYYYDQLSSSQKENLLVFGIMSLVLIIAISVFIYFMMRSRMIADIYPIGVYRSIGASRMRILLRFVSDIFVTISLTALIGYVLTTFIFDTIAANVNNTLSMNALKSSYLFGFLGVVILYALNFIFGLLPIFMLMRKTPAEIIAKYDI